ncbi:type IX secretion system outer membrane channel protein PorV [Hymenobacter ginsengisoli]|uniref:Type IX secretion system outer membrane channel protein PorV n=1 Tax=Hymenobacter ginsengisoli TaxID=1051626 RepID=A0ABP8QCF4_9BACT|nr:MULTISPECIES: type IX secretion system outer membrane channel protein PorV [unclassified Hymenobacter]MBO2031585.1 type IX secretion system outer membrane channel protein PorV [Hymenobacter sp. BT559]
MPFFRTLGVTSALLALAAPAALAQVANAQTHTTTTAVPILMLSPDARGAALGDAGVATSPDANAAFYNPGKLGFVNYKYAVSPSYSPWLRQITDDMSLSYLSGYGKVGERGAIAASLMYFSLGQIDYRDGSNLPTGTFNPKEYAFTMSYGQKLGENFGLGISARYVRSNLVGNTPGNDAQAGNSFAADLGVYYSKDATIGTGVYNLAFGAAVTNLGNKMVYADPQNASFLPTQLRLGTALTREIDPYNKITLAFDATKLLVPSPYYEDPYNNQDITQVNRVKQTNIERQQQGIVSGIFSSFHDAPGGFKGELQQINLHTGLEYWYNNTIAARVGYFYENPHTGDRQYLSFGLGARLSVFGIDGTYLVPNSQANPVANTIRVSLHFNLNKLADAFDEKGAGGTQGTLPN